MKKLIMNEPTTKNYELVKAEWSSDDEITIHYVNELYYDVSTSLTLRQTPYVDCRFFQGQELKGCFSIGDDENNSFDLFWPFLDEESEDFSQACDWNKLFIRML